MALTPYLTFNGNAEEVLEYYRAALDGQLDIMRFGGTPAEAHVPADWSQKVMHGRVTSPVGTVMISDATPDRVNKIGDNFSIAVMAETEAQAESVFSKLSAGGTVTMP